MFPSGSSFYQTKSPHRVLQSPGTLSQESHHSAPRLCKTRSPPGSKSAPFVVEKTRLSTSYFKPRTLESFEKYFRPMRIEGYLDKQSKENKDEWSTYYAVMQNGTIYFYNDKVLADLGQSNDIHEEDVCCDYIPFDSIKSIKTATEIGENVFILHCSVQKFVLRAPDKDGMQNWLFEFHRSVMNMIESMVTRKTDSRTNPLRNSLNFTKSRKIDRRFSYDRSDQYESTSGYFMETLPSIESNEDNVSSVEIENSVTVSSCWVPPHRRSGFTYQKEDDNIFDMVVGEEIYVEETIPFRKHGVTSLIGARESMEDVCCCLDEFKTTITSPTSVDLSLYAVYDGHSGIKAAEFMDKSLPQLLGRHPQFYTNIKQAFIDIFSEIDRQFLIIARSQELYDGSTAAILLLRGKQLITANAGDSRAVMSCSGIAYDVIQKQNPGREDERQRIYERGGWIREEQELNLPHLDRLDLSDPLVREKAEKISRWNTIYRVNGELSVSRSIGDIDYKGCGLNEYFWAFPKGHSRKFLGDLIISEPEVIEMDIPDDAEFIILACDGVWDILESQEAVDHVAKSLKLHGDPQIASVSLSQLASQFGSSDNISVVIVILNNSIG